ncbi:MAG: sulfatase-like hydrolase/transferase [Opitutae bacterium]|nr:sulfatase-like hydrolase/transferase [Opitutae bacterium]
MKISTKLIVGALSVAPFTISAQAADGASASGARPNIIFILVDDMGWGDLNVNWEKYGNSFKYREHPNKYKTPSLDKMAKEGMLLLRHYTAAPVSVAARACLITGMHTGHTRNVRDNNFDHPIADVHTLGSVLKQAGYSTAVIGKWGVGGGGQSNVPTTAMPTARGFDYFWGLNAHLGGHFHYPANNASAAVTAIWENDKIIHSQKQGIKNGLEKVSAYSTDLFAARAKKWIMDNDPAKTKKPFFLMLNFTAPHASLRVPPSSYPRGGGKTGGLQWVETKDGTQTCNTSTQELATKAGAHWIGRDEFIHPDNKKFVGDGNQRHSTMVRRVDDAVGDIRRLLSDMKIADNTLVIFTSDNGPHNEAGSDSDMQNKPAQDPQYFKTYGMMDGIKRDTDEGGIREPTIVCWPAQIKGGKTSLHPSQFQDWLPTFADAAGLPAPSSSSGVSLLPDLTGKGGQQMPSDIYIEYSVDGATPNYKDFLPKHRGASRKNQFVVFVDGYKGHAIDIGDKPLNETVFEIYDTEKDPQEKNDLAGKPIDKKLNLQARMREKLLTTRRPVDGAVGREAKAFFEKPVNAVPAVAPENATKPAQLDYKIFTQKDAFPWVPDFRQTHLAVAKSGSLKTADDAGNLIPADAKTLAGSGAVGVALDGFIDIPADGEYVFYLKTDKTAGSKAFVHLHEVMPLIDADKLYTPGAQASSYMNLGTQNKQGTKKVLLKKGLHPIRIEYVCAANNAAPSLEMSWQKPGAANAEAIPASAFVAK